MKTEKGLIIAGALGFVAADIKKWLRVIESLNEDDIKKAKTLISKGKVNLSIKGNCNRFNIEVILITSKEKARIIILENHLNIVSIEKIGKECEFKPFIAEKQKTNLSNKIIQKYDLKHFLKFADEISIDELSFLEDGVGAKFMEMITEGLMSDNMITRAQVLCAAASEARMSGSKLSVMSTSGSGNHGITAFLTIFAVTEKRNLPEEKLIRALALTNLITIFIKSYTGILSAMCGCGVAAGIGASAGVVYLLGGKRDQILGAMYKYGRVNFWYDL